MRVEFDREIRLQLQRALRPRIFTSTFRNSSLSRRAPAAGGEKWVIPGQTPARATIEAKLANPAYKIEIMCIAAP